MIYCQLHNRASLSMGQSLTLGDVARTIAPQPLDKVTLPCPKEAGVWRVSAIDVTQAIAKACPGEEVSLLGPDACYVHRVRREGNGFLRLLRTGAAFLILLLGGALGLAWFHSDVDMPKAQMMVYETIAGHEPEDPRQVNIPYVVGVVLGVSVFYALPSRSRSTPMEVKLNAYLQDMEQTEGKDVNDDA